MFPAMLSLAFVLTARRRYPRPDVFEQTKSQHHAYGGNAFRLYMVAAMLLGLGFADWALLTLHASRREFLEPSIFPILYSAAVAIGGSSAKLVRMTHFRRISRLSSWRTLSLNAWGRPRDPTIYGTLQVDVTAAIAYLAAQERESGVKVTLTHLVGKAVAEAIATRPEVNAVIRRGHAVYQRDSIDIFFQVAFDGGEDLSGVKVAGADKKSVIEIARELQDRAERIRAHHDRDFTDKSQLLARLPTLARSVAMRAIEYVSYDLGIDVSRLHLPQDAFGSAMVTNVGMFGLPQAFAPLVPFSRAPIVITVGAVEQRPWVVDGAMEVCPVLTLSATLDHRLLDGYQAGQLAGRLKEILMHPATALSVM